MNTYLDRWFGTDDLGKEMRSLYGCVDGSINCHEQIMEFTVAQDHVSFVTFHALYESMILDLSKHICFTNIIR